MMEVLSIFTINLMGLSSTSMWNDPSLRGVAMASLTMEGCLGCRGQNSLDAPGRNGLRKFCENLKVWLSAPAYGIEWLCLKPPG